MTQTPLPASALPPVAALDHYRQRRERVLAALRARGGGVAIVPTAAEVRRNRDVDYPYRHDSYFYYLTGFTEPEALLVLDASAAPGEPSTILFCRARNVERETWEGLRCGPERAPAVYGVDAAFAFDERDTRMPQLLADQPALHYALGTSTQLDDTVRGWLDAVRARNRSGISTPTAAYDLIPLLDEMRVIKDAHECAIMRRAGQISALAHRRAMAVCRPGLHEYALEAELLHTFRQHGAQAPAYGSIVAAGANACVLHYPAGNTVIQDGDLILIDAACELDGYASDITRTFPANGRFTPAQRTLYDIVLAAQQAAIAATRAGVSFDAPHQAAVRVLAQGLLETGILSRERFASVEEVISERAYLRFYMHRTSHWIGMDVHDCGDYFEPHPAPGVTTGANAGGGASALSHTGNTRPARTLVEGMTLTIEPGLYIPAADDVPAQYWNTGIRIEDDVIVTATGCELMTRDVPVSADAIETLMQAAQAELAATATSAAISPAAPQNHPAP
ncbi:aminopeptidase P N-terminal domain-containing protein [Paraburkholderia bonniea]|uniref:aminopeptidase P N-terminal domain-containing protein n=1 Tax=Paraburkholderia bonniea TaxID=2152891 RepID=UPI001FEBA85A|nr:aminopeptidase P N-terminal domain-containing protein [Paraburkholderia bonniea]WJF89824.1 aminopeptidase P N-terminal domain-containing protein [Paraburkholderia bonniea]WJF93138.1 aminopeptidase P N-terminal domain-containing protein [Paraburkholderia bonniea]